MKTWINKILASKRADGRTNGSVIRVWEGEVPLGYGPKQVYVTTLLPGEVKGPHLHMKRESVFCCVRGTVRITTREETYRPGLFEVVEHPRDCKCGSCSPERRTVLHDTAKIDYGYQTVTSGIGTAGDAPVSVHVPCGVPCQLYNPGHDEAYVVVVSSTPFDPEDEHPVEDWRSKCLISESRVTGARKNSDARSNRSARRRGFRIG